MLQLSRSPAARRSCGVEAPRTGSKAQAPWKRAPDITSADLNGAIQRLIHAAKVNCSIWSSCNPLFTAPDKATIGPSPFEHPPCPPTAFLYKKLQKQHCSACPCMAFGVVHYRLCSPR